MPGKIEKTENETEFKAMKRVTTETEETNLQKNITDTNNGTTKNKSEKKEKPKKSEKKVKKEKKEKKEKTNKTEKTDKVENKTDKVENKENTDKSEKKDKKTKKEKKNKKEKKDKKDKKEKKNKKDKSEKTDSKDNKDIKTEKKEKKETDKKKNDKKDIKTEKKENKIENNKNNNNNNKAVKRTISQTETTEKKETRDFDCYDVPVKVKGKGAPTEAIKSFEDSQFPNQLLQNIKNCGYEKPTPIQAWTIPTLLSSHDVMACAQTGSGKTAAYLLPIISSMVKQKILAERIFNRGFVKPTALILAPTRELAIQIKQEAVKFITKIGYRVGCVYGGAPYGTQIREIASGCEILCATPGRLTDMWHRGILSLANVKFFILDEADRMLDMGFEPQIREILTTLDLPANDKRQTMMYSATFPKDIRLLAEEFLNEYIFITVGKVGAATQLVTQEFIEIRGDPFEQLLTVIKQIEPTKENLVLVFVETKMDAQELERYLKAEAFPSVAMHGDKTQQERELSLRLFTAGKKPILIATDIASRGLDIDDIRCVINLDLPRNTDSYIHRIGRTGRAGKQGKAITFINHRINQSKLRDLVKILIEAKQEIPSFLQKYAVDKSSGGRGGRGFGGYGGRNNGGGGYGGYGGYGGRNGGGGGFGGYGGRNGGGFGGNSGGFGGNRGGFGGRSNNSNSNGGGGYYDKNETSGANQPKRIKF